jgi:Uma2 family endonuclease
MSTAPASKTALMTAEEFSQRSDPGCPEELVRGKIVPLAIPDPRHGQICNKVGRIFGNLADTHDLGHVLNNDSGVITERGPDTVRGADIAFYSYERVPRGKLPRAYLSEMPELVVEVRSKLDRWPKVLAKAAEYLDAGVSVVVALDDEETAAHIITQDQNPILSADDELALPAILPGFSVKVGRFFE